MLFSIKETVTNRNIKNNIDGFIKAIPTGIEYFCNSFTPLKLDGYANLMMNDKEFYYNCHEIILEYDLFDNIKSKPEHRLCYSLLVNAMLCHKINTMNETNNLNKPINDDLKQKYSSI